MGIPNIPERFLRQIWQHQHFSTANLHTADGKPVTIIDPGKPNRDGGPDFTNARIRIGAINYNGDVELHQDASEWHAHNHARNARYNRVILHVVLTADPITPPAITTTDRPIPLLVLHPYLDETLRSTWMKAIIDERNERLHTIACHSLNDDVPATTILHWIEKLAHERVELKVRRYEERLKQLVDEGRDVMCEPYPRYYENPDEIPVPHKEYTQRDFASRPEWEQLLYEAVMEAMGYAKNTEPFLALAQAMRLDILRQHPLNNVHTMTALLFGAAGLLPPDRKLSDIETRTFVRTLRHRWEGLRPSFKGGLLHEGEWQFFRLRPNNFPTARLAAVCHLLPRLFGEESFLSLITAIKREEVSAKERIKILYAFFEFEADEFWQHHLHFGGTGGAAGIALGTPRINDVLVNGIIPIMLLYARIFRDHVVRENAREVLATLPPLQENTITDTIQKQLLKEKGTLRSPLHQQGAIQLYKFYCVPVRCSECEVGRKTRLGGKE